MWGHKAIPDLLRLAAQTSPEIAAGLREIVSGIRNAVHFHVGAMEDLEAAAWRDGMGPGAFQGDLAEGIRLPYPECWFEFEIVSMYPEKPPLRSAALVRRWEGEDDILRIDTVNYSPGKDAWFPSGDRHFVLVGSTFRHKPEFFAWAMKTYRKTMGRDYREDHPTNLDGNGFRIPLSPRLEMDAEIRRNALHWDVMAISAVNLFLLLLSCKNIETEEIAAPERLNRKRRKSGKEPVFSYRVLNITVPGAGGKRAIGPGGSGDGATKRLHLCRGHFKVYTAANPLFGRLTGRYWWEPHVRGDRAAGIVGKEYRAKIRKDGEQ